jgi:hypothetical protein
VKTLPCSGARSGALFHGPLEQERAAAGGERKLQGLAIDRLPVFVADIDVCDVHEELVEPRAPGLRVDAAFEPPPERLDVPFDGLRVRGPSSGAPPCARRARR